MFYPLKFKPLYKDYVWGGRNLEKLGKQLPEGIVAESWEVSCHRNGQSVVANGEFEGITLQALVERFGRSLLGNALAEKDIKKFPLLIKLIDAENNLSVQVHPDDSYAFVHEGGEYGKNEMWYIVDAKPGARLVYDVLPGTTRESFAEAVSESRVEGCLKSVEVHPGDVVNIPSGLVHAIGRGIILAEVQQNSDTTYRVYDYGRTGRELHIAKALDVIDFNSEGRREIYRGLSLDLGEGCIKTFLVANEYFSAESYDLNGKTEEYACGDKFSTYTFLDGSGCLKWETGEMEVGSGESVLIPASMGFFSLSGRLKALKAYVPDLKADVIGPLEASGRDSREILLEVAGLSKFIEI